MGEIAAREGKHPIDAMLDVAVAGQLQGRLRDTDARDAAGRDEGGRHLAGGASRRERRWCPHQVRDHGALSDRAPRLLGPRARDHVARGGALAALATIRPSRQGSRTGASWPRERRPTSIVYDPETLDSLHRSDSGTTRPGEWRLVQKAVGYERIIVNGVTTFIDGECTGNTPGKLLRHGADLRRSTMTPAESQIGEDVRCRQPLLGGQRRLHPPPRPEVRRPRRRPEGDGRKAALLLRRAGAPDHPRSR